MISNDFPIRIRFESTFYSRRKSHRIKPSRILKKVDQTGRRHEGSGSTRKQRVENKMKTERYCCEKNPPSFGVEIMFVVIFPSAFLFEGKSVGSFLKSCKRHYRSWFQGFCIFSFTPIWKIPNFKENSFSIGLVIETNQYY